LKSIIYRVLYGSFFGMLRTQINKYLIASSW